MKVKKFRTIKSELSVKWIFRKILCYIYTYSLIPYLLVAIHSLFHKRKEYKYQVSLCLIFKDEASYLKEWLEYHKLIGVEHFYLYNNNSTDDFMKILQPYIDSNIITLHDWPRNYAQVSAYEHCYRNYNKESHWIGFLDTDEFINVSVEAGNNLKLFLQKYNLYPSLHIFWRIFGTSGIMHKDNSQLITEQYTSCWPFLCDVGKAFINNNWEFSTIWLHWHKASFFGIPLFAITDHYQFTPYGIVYPHFGYNPKIMINHYWTKSYEEAIYKTYIRSDAYTQECENLRKKNGIKYFELNCSVKDFSIQRWLSYLKAAIENKPDTISNN